MKRIAFSAVLVVLMLILAAGGFIYTQNVTAAAVEDLTAIISAYKNDAAKDQTVQAIDRLESNWDSFCSTHIFITDNEHILDITSSIAKIRELADQWDDGMLVECESARKLLEIYRQEQIPNILNVL